MSLEIKVNRILQDFDNVSSDEFLKVINEIMLEFRSSITIDYLKGKIQKITVLTNESEKKKQCKLLLPCFDCYVQGL